MQANHNDKSDRQIPALGDPRIQRYEQEKLAWIKFNPNASQRQYEQAMQDIARRCGV